MTMTKPLLYQILVITIGIWLMLFVALPSNPDYILKDPDSQWHIAAGDALREQGKMAIDDPWAFTSNPQEQRWFNVSWLWDIAYSHIYETLGWHGVMVATSATIASTLAVVFFLSFLRSGNGIASYLTVFAALTILNAHARPFQVSLLLIAAVYGVLEAVASRRISMRWLAVIPAIMVLWVNVHGGFFAAFLLLGIYGLSALIRRDAALFKALFLCGSMSLLACLINPYGINLFYENFRSLGGSVNEVIDEWQPMKLTFINMALHLYIPLFLLLLIMRPVAMSLTEKLCIFVWFLLGMSSGRHMPIFLIVSAPIFASMLANVMQAQQKKRPIHPFMQRLSETANIQLRKPQAVIVASLSALVTLIIIASPLGEKWYGNQVYTPVIGLTAELDFIEKNFPNVLFYNDYNLGGSLIFQSRGAFKLFIDGRAGTAYPDQVIEDYIAFIKNDSDWQQRFDRYPIGGILLHKADAAVSRLDQLRGWRRVFEGNNGVVFIREKMR